MNDSKSILDAATTEYFAWLRQILAISSTALTLLIALRSQLVPENPTAIWLLQLSWVSLMATIAFALWGTAGHHALLLKAASIYRHKERTRDPRNETISVPRRYMLCAKFAPWAFLSALVCLGVFGVLNIGTHSVNKQPIATPGPTTAPTANGRTLPAPSTPPDISTNA